MLGLGPCPSGGLPRKGRLQLADFVAVRGDRCLPLSAAIDVAGVLDQVLKRLDALDLGGRG
jgi:hypothetical protein